MRASDLLEIQIGNVENGYLLHSELVKLIVGLADLMAEQVEKVVATCFEWDKHEVLFTAVKLLTTRMESHGFHVKFIKTMYVESI